MKAAPTLDGRIRIDIESKLDWMVMRAICHDAEAADGDLVDRLGGVLDNDEASADWEEFVLPDLRQGFSSQLAFIERELESLEEASPQTLFIIKEDAEIWYGGLNQARLALEDRFGFLDGDPEEMTPGKRTAWFRAQFYQMLQSLLLEFLMRN